MDRALTLTVMEQVYSVCRLAPGEAIPGWAARGDGLCSITRTADELSVICEAQRVPADVRREDGWRVLRLEGPFAFDELGVSAAVLVPLREAGVPSLMIATFDTDYLLVKDVELARAERALRDAGHRVQR